MFINKISAYLISDEKLDIKHILEKICNNVQHLHTETSEIANDDTSVLEPNCDLAYCERYFKKEPNDNASERKVLRGRSYKHFKTGKIVTVLEVAQDTENPGSWYVVYKCPAYFGSSDFGVWCRPLDMFLSKVDTKVDTKKYPNANQHYRFELVEDIPSIYDDAYFWNDEDIK